MSTIKAKLDYLDSTKDAIKESIQSRGVTVSAGAPFRYYADLIKKIETPEGFEEVKQSLEKMYESLCNRGLTPSKTDYASWSDEIRKLPKVNLVLHYKDTIKGDILIEDTTPTCITSTITGNVNSTSLVPTREVISEDLSVLNNISIEGDFTCISIDAISVTDTVTAKL